MKKNSVDLTSRCSFIIEPFPLWPWTAFSTLPSLILACAWPKTISYWFMMTLRSNYTSAGRVLGPQRDLVFNATWPRKSITVRLTYYRHVRLYIRVCFDTTPTINWAVARVLRRRRRPRNVLNIEYFALFHVVCVNDIAALTADKLRVA